MHTAPGGIFLRELPQKFESHCGVKLDPKTFASSSVDNIVFGMQDCIEVTYKGQYQVLLTLKKDELTTSAVCIPQPACSQYHVNLSLPADAVVPGVTLSLIHI